MIQNIQRQLRLCYRVELQRILFNHGSLFKFSKETHKAQNINDYQLGLGFLEQGKFRLAHEFLRRVLKQQIIDDYSDIWLSVQNKIALTQNHLRKYEECEKTLENIIEMQIKNGVNDDLLYISYNNLLIHCLNTNLNKAILLGKQLMSEENIQKIPRCYKNKFQFNLGTAYLLKENFVEAKERLRECIESEPNDQLKGFALNNLAVASWWHKMPNLREFVSDDEEELLEGQQQEDDEDQIDLEFKEVIPLLKRSIKYIDKGEPHDLQKQLNLDQLLDENTIIPKEFKTNQNLFLGSVQLNSKYCGIPLLNITEFIFNKDKQKRIEAQFWFKYSLKCFEKNDPTHMDRSLILLAWLCSSSKQYGRAEILFTRTLQMLESADSYNKVLCLQLYGSMLKQNPKRVNEGEKLIAQAYSLAEELPSWSNKLVHVLIPEMEL